MEEEEETAGTRVGIDEENGGKRSMSRVERQNREVEREESEIERARGGGGGWGRGSSIIGCRMSTEAWLAVGFSMLTE